MDIGYGTVKQNSADIDALIKDYSVSELIHEGMPEIKFKWSVYKLLEQYGALSLFTVRDAGKLIGFAIYGIQDHPNHDEQRVAQCTMLIVRPECRHNGIGHALIGFAEFWLKANGTTHIVHHISTQHDVIPLYSDLGFKLVEHCYVKEL